MWPLRTGRKFIRTKSVRLTRIAGARHYSSPLSCAEILAALHYAQMQVEPSDPKWPNRERLIMSKGNAAIGLYPVLADLGYFDPTEPATYTRLDRTMTNTGWMRPASPLSRVNFWPR